MELNHYYKDFTNTMNTIRESKYKKIIYFGTGNMATILQDYLPINIEYCVDNDLQKQGNMFNNLSIKSPSILEQEEKEEIFIIIASIYFDEIKHQLEDMGFIENIHFSNGNTIYNFIFTSQDIIEARVIVNKICTMRDYTPKKILIAGDYNWLELNYNKLALLGIENSIEILVVYGNVECRRVYKFNILDSYRSINFKGINLFNVSVYNICVELEISINELDYKNEIHKNVILKWFNKSCNYIEQVISYFNIHNFSKVIIAQGYFYDTAILRQIAIKKNIEVLSFEYTFNKDKFIWDNVSGISVNKNLAKNYFWRYKDLVDIETAKNYTRKLIKDVKKFKKLEHQSPTKKINVKCKKKRIFYIAQVYTDSSILFGIWNFISQIDIIKVLVEYSVENNYELIIKTHPKEIDGRDAIGRRYDNLTFRKIKQDKELLDKINKNNNILIDYKNEYDTYGLIESSDICVTINSQAGLESLVKGKDVILCGSSSYDGLGFTYEAHNKEMLRFFLDMVLKQGISIVNKDRIDKFFYIFNEYYCVNRNEALLIEKILE